MSYVLLEKADDSVEAELVTFDDEVFETFGVAETAARDAWLEGDAVLIGKIELVDWDPPTCSAQTYAGSRHVDPEPSEYCAETAELGSEFCAGHGDEQ